jgi:predicted nucleic acid-binding protein
MTFTDIPAGSDVFLDANIFVYYTEPHPIFGPSCQQLLLRIENKELQGFTSSAIPSSVVHRVMTLEAAAVYQRAMQGMVGWLKRHPAEIQRLSRHKQVVDDLSLIGIQMLEVSGSHVSLAADLSRQFGLLTDDALLVSVTRYHGLQALASNDADFDRVPGLTRYAPV